MPLKVGKHHMECFQVASGEDQPANQLISCADYAATPSAHGNACTTTANQLMIFDLFYNQFGQVIDQIELVEGAIFRTILTDYDLPG
jgi:hypothetical protein